MQQTPNLLLKLPEPTDFVQVEDLNENFTKIDTEIAKITDEETGVEAKLAKHLDDDARHVTQAFKDTISSNISTAYNLANEVQIELRAFKSALTEGFTANQFSDGLTTLDALNVTAGYYNQSLSRLEV